MELFLATTQQTNHPTMSRKSDGQIQIPEFILIRSCIEFKCTSSDMEMQDVYKKDLENCQEPMKMVNSVQATRPSLAPSSPPGQSGRRLASPCHWRCA